MTADGPSAACEAQSPDPATEAAFSQAADSVEAAALGHDVRLRDQARGLQRIVYCVLSLFFESLFTMGPTLVLPLPAMAQTNHHTML